MIQNAQIFIDYVLLYENATVENCGICNFNIMHFIIYRISMTGYTNKYLKKNTHIIFYIWVLLRDWIFKQKYRLLYLHTNIKQFNKYLSNFFVITKGPVKNLC